MPPRASRPTASASAVSARPRRIDFERQILMQAPPDATGYCLVILEQEPAAPSGVAAKRRNATATQIWQLSPFERPEDVGLEPDQHYQIQWVDKDDAPVGAMPLSGAAWLHYFEGIPDPAVPEDEMIDRVLRTNLALRQERDGFRSRLKALAKETRRWKRRSQKLRAALKASGGKFHLKDAAIGAAAGWALSHIPLENIAELVREKGPEYLEQLLGLLRDSEATQQQEAVAEKPADWDKQGSAPHHAENEEPSPVPVAEPMPEQVAGPQGARADTQPRAKKKAASRTVRLGDALTLALAQTEVDALAGAIAVMHCLGNRPPITEAEVHALQTSPASQLREQFQAELVKWHCYGAPLWGPPRDAADRVWRDVVRAFSSPCHLARLLEEACAKLQDFQFSTEASQYVAELVSLWGSYEGTWQVARSADQKIGTAQHMLKDHRKVHKAFSHLSKKSPGTNFVALCHREAIGMLRSALASLQALGPSTPTLKSPSSAQLTAALNLAKTRAGQLSAAVAVARCLGPKPMSDSEITTLHSVPKDELQQCLQKALLHLAGSRELSLAPVNGTYEEIWLTAGLAFNSICYLGDSLQRACAKRNINGFSREASNHVHLLDQLWEEYGDAWPTTRAAHQRIGMVQRMLTELQVWYEELRGLPKQTSATRVLARCAREAIKMIQGAKTVMESSQPVQTSSDARVQPVNSPKPAHPSPLTNRAPSPPATTSTPEGHSPERGSKGPPLEPPASQLELPLGAQPMVPEAAELDPAKVAA